MSRISRLVVLVTTIASLAAALSSTAGAVTWHNGGSTAFTATGGAFTLSATGVNWACPSASVTGTSPSGSFVGATYVAASGTLHYNGCSFSGITTSVTCGYVLTATAQTGIGGATVTTGNFDLTCDITQFGTKICHIENHNPSLHAQYTNPSGGTSGRFTLTAGFVRVTRPATGSCPFGDGDTAGLAHQAFAISAPAGGGPIITRTA